MREEAQAPLDMLTRHGDDLQAAFEDEALNAALAPYRGLGPIRLHCRREKRKRTISWCALDLHRVRIIASPLGPRKPGVRDDQIPPEQLRLQPQPPFDNWSPGPFWGWDVGERVDPAKPPQAQLQWYLTCPDSKCGMRYLVTNSQMIEWLIRAIESGHDMVLPRSSEFSGRA